jgi:hypothetical protein
MDSNEISAKVDELASLTRQAADIKARMDTLKGYFETVGVDALKATKDKTVEFWGSAGKVDVGRSEKVSPISVNMLRQVFGGTFGDFFKEKITYDPSEPCKRLLASIFLGNYIETPLTEVINQITGDEKIRATLKKKLRGDFKKDKAALISIANLSEQDAEYYAYMSTEAAAYERFNQVIAAGKFSGTAENAKEIIRASIIVEEGVKVTVNTSDESEK